MEGLNSLMKKISGSKLVLSVTIALATAGFLIALTPVSSGAQDPSFFQGFETDASNWFPYDFATVDRVPSSDPSSSYNSGTTSAYASGINAASGGYFGRVTSAISTSGPGGDPTKGSCVIDTTGAIGPSLLCYGPYTLFGRDVNVPFPFPEGGYTIQLDIYLDAVYASQHPDCITGPCTPNTPGTLNPACNTGPTSVTTDPNGINCEGSRFDWTVALNNPAATGEIAPEFVFSVGTAPAPSNYGLTCASGWIITAGYNSFRSGGDTYNSGFEPKCLSTSGWYTFKQVFKDDGTGNLEVDFSILDPSGNAVACTDAITGSASTCEWVKKPGNAITDVGCPRFGWLANEEINDLPLDNTLLTVVAADGCGLVSQGQITPTGTTCQQYANGTATTLDLLLYTEKNGLINSVSPGVFFYYAKVSGSGTVTIAESVPPGASPIDIQKLQAVVYSADCTKLKLLTVNDGGATGTLPATGGPFIIGVKYDASTLKGTPVPDPSPATYTFNTKLNGTTLNDSASIELSKK